MNTLTSKRITIIFLILAILVLGWMVYQLRFADRISTSQNPAVVQEAISQYLKSKETLTPAVATVLDTNLTLKSFSDAVFKDIPNSVNVFPKDILRTSTTGRAVIENPQGTVDVLDYNSELAIQDKTTEEGSSRFLKGGSVWTRTEKVLGQGEFHEMETQNAVAVIRGTSFGVMYAQSLTTVIITRGKVGVIPVNLTTRVRAYDKEVIVSAGNKATVNDAGEIVVTPISKADKKMPWFMFNAKNEIQPAAQSAVTPQLARVEPVMSEASETNQSDLSLNSPVGVGGASDIVSDQIQPEPEPRRRRSRGSSNSRQEVITQAATTTESVATLTDTATSTDTVSPPLASTFNTVFDTLQSTSSTSTNSTSLPGTPQATTTTSTSTDTTQGSAVSTSSPQTDSPQATSTSTDPTVPTEPAATSTTATSTDTATTTEPIIPTEPTATSTQATSTQATSTPSVGSLITIFAAGTQGGELYPTMELLLDDVVVQTYEGVQGDPQQRMFEQFTYQHSTTTELSRIKIRYPVDFYEAPTNDRNLAVDKIKIDDAEYETEASTTFGTGILAPDGSCISGHHSTEWLYCAGYFQYGVDEPEPQISNSDNNNVQP
ncbi:MAG: FecR domain-containing protein [bacterium]|nr:FecR domain-containing protein [bacterium]